jgi:hypothetical protein
MSGSNIVALISTVIAGISAIIAYIAIERSDVAAITNIQRDIKELKDKQEQLSRTQEQFNKSQAQVQQTTEALQNNANRQISGKRTLTITQASFKGITIYNDKLLRLLKGKCDGKERCDIETDGDDIKQITAGYDGIQVIFFCGVTRMPPVEEAKGPVLILSCPQQG